MEQVRMTIEEQDARLLAHSQKLRAEIAEKTRRAEQLEDLARREAEMAARIQAFLNEMRQEKAALQSERESLLAA